MFTNSGKVTRFRQKRRQLWEPAPSPARTGLQSLRSRAGRIVAHARVGGDPTAIGSCILTPRPNTSYSAVDRAIRQAEAAGEKTGTECGKAHLDRSTTYQFRIGGDSTGLLPIEP